MIYDAISMIMTYALYLSVNTVLRYSSETRFARIIRLFSTVIDFVHQAPILNSSN